MNDWRSAARRSRQVFDEAFDRVADEMRTQVRWVERALAQDRDTLRRTLCFCGENTARALLAATRQAQADAGNAWRQVPWMGRPALGAVWALGGMLQLASRGVIVTAVAYDVISNLARTEDVQ